jgi:hypothetical protein
MFNAQIRALVQLDKPMVGNELSLYFVLYTMAKPNRPDDTNELAVHVAAAH